MVRQAVVCSWVWGCQSKWTVLCKVGEHWNMPAYTAHIGALVEKAKGPKTSNKQSLPNHCGL